MKKKFLLVFNVFLLLITIGLAYAFFSGVIEGEGKEIFVVAKKIKVVFTDNSEFINREIEPGWRESKTFKVENEGSDRFSYNLVFKNLQNTFLTEGYLKYKITSTNGGYNMTEFEVIPKQGDPSDFVIAYSIDIDGGEVQNYTVEFMYEYSDTVDQSEDMGQLLKGTIFIEVGTEDPNLPISSKVILANNNYSSAVERTSFNNIETESKLWKADIVKNDEEFTTYYFTGNPDNWVSFAGYLWRIIRVNGDGSVRLLYAGSGGEDAFIGITPYNTNRNHPGYVGFKYNLGSTLDGIRGETESTILERLNSWYEENILDEFDSYVSREAIFCNDRELASGSSFTTSNNTFYYSSRERVYDVKVPSFDCNNLEDRFTGVNLKYPVGLMTADEVAFAGGLYGNDNTSAYYYLNKSGGSATGSNWWWTMSPCYWLNGMAGVFSVGGSGRSGRLSNDAVNSSLGIRPVISLKSCTTIDEGNGSSNSPYKVSISEKCSLKEM